MCHLTAKPCSLPYVAHCSCHDFSASARLVDETYALPAVSLKMLVAQTWNGRYDQPGTTAPRRPREDLVGLLAAEGGERCVEELGRREPGRQAAAKGAAASVTVINAYSEMFT